MTTHLVYPTPAEAHAEGPVARTIEEQTARLPSDTFLGIYNKLVKQLGSDRTENAV